MEASRSWPGRGWERGGARIVRYRCAKGDAMIPARVQELLAEPQFLRFLVAGGVNTLFGFGVNIAVMLAGCPVWLSMLVGTVAGVAFNFFTHGGYAFRDLSARRLPR